MSNQKTKLSILFAEDDINLSMVLIDYLEMLNYKINHANNGIEALNLFSKNKYDLVILDIMMPKKDGFAVAKEIRENNSTIPIIFLTAKNQKDDRIKGFNFGCDDYITKPFSTEELKLRIKAILRRCSMGDIVPNNQYIFTLGEFQFDSKNMILKNKNNQTRSLTRKESALLELLCKNKNELLPREVALETIWGENDYFIGRSMDVFITKLRKYLRPDPKIKITNVHGIGFKLEIEDESI